MRQPSKIWTSLFLATLLPFVGCGGPGIEDANPPQDAGPKVPAEESKTKGGEQASADANGEVPAKDVTPNRLIDPKAVVDIVEAEVQGGEAQKGPSPEGIFWAFPDTEKIADEPLEVTMPLGLPDLIPGISVPVANPITRGKYELGRQLYFDPRISQNGTVSCATCHDPAKGWTDRMPTSIGINGQVGSRSAPTVLNTAYGKSMFWDGRAPSLEAQSQGPPQNPIEMGKQSYEEIINRLRTIPSYREQFQKVFGTDVTLDGVSKAIATFERVAALSGNSKYDQYRAGQVNALSESEKRGMVLFGERLNPDDDFQTDVKLQKARCTLCHIGFNFTDEKFHNLGVGWDASAGKFTDPGRWSVTPVGSKDLTDLGAFKTPTVRDAARTAPYLHDGSEATLEELVEFYNKGGNPNPNLDKDMKPLNLTDQEKADVVAFIKALTGEVKVVELPTLPPGADGTAPDPKAALEPPVEKAASTLQDNPHLSLVR